MRVLYDFVNDIYTTLPQVTDIHYELHVNDHSWPKLYQPIEKSVNRIARLVSRMQTGNIRVYLSYSFFTLIFLLWVIS
jgi:hypothetical protein